jgi:hypothetical protein
VSNATTNRPPQPDSFRLQQQVQPWDAGMSVEAWLVFTKKDIWMLLVVKKMRMVHVTMQVPHFHSLLWKTVGAVHNVSRIRMHAKYHC